jgi:hypothetical protein
MIVAIPRRHNRSNLTGKINGWKILNTLTMHYGDRVTAAGNSSPSRSLTQTSGQSPRLTWR